MSNNSMTDDMKLVERLSKQKTLDNLVAQLDVSDVPGSLKRVPKEVIRLALALLPVRDIDKTLETVESSQRRPAQSLLKSIRSQGAEAFFDRLRELVLTDEQIREDLGVRLGSSSESGTSMEAKIDNTITNVVSAPHLMLKSKSLCVEITFVHNEDILLRSELQFDELLFLTSCLTHASKLTLEQLADYGTDLGPNIQIERCEKHLKEIRKHVRKLSSLFQQQFPTKPRKVRKPVAKKSRA